MQACMDASDWLKGFVQEDGGTGSTSPSSELPAPCARLPVLERRLRPQHEQALKCPRCDSSHTKFCYYNNYSLSQPRYFCKTCRRYWTKGGSLRNVPVGGGCRKNKRASKKAPEHHLFGYPHQVVPNFHDGTERHISFSPGMQSSLLDQLKEPPRNLNFMECNYGLMHDSSMNGEFMIDSKFGRGHMFMSASDVGVGDVGDSTLATLNLINPHNSTISFNFSDSNDNALLMDSCTKLSLPFHGQDDAKAVEIKPANRILSLEWKENGQGACSDVNHDSFAYSNGLGLWGGMINGQGPSATI